MPIQMIINHLYGRFMCFIFNSGYTFVESYFASFIFATAPSLHPRPFELGSTLKEKNMLTWATKPVASQEIRIS